MSSEITVENLGKRYLLGHKNRARPDTLRDRLTLSKERIVHRIRHPFLSGGSDQVEYFWALQKINFEMQKGDRLGIIGRNGAGKSTLLKILSRIVEPTTGKITMRGRVSSLLEVGTGFHPELTGRENIYLNGAILGMSKNEIDRRFDEIVDFSEVEQFLDTPVKRYSSGMYVRLAFSVAAHLEPEIFVVDEVLAVGDTAFQKKCLNKMELIGSQGRTVIFVSHNMRTVQQLCNRALVLDKGRLAFSGSVEEATDHYLGAQHRTGDHWPLVRDLYTEPDLFHFTQIRLNGREPTASMMVNGREPIELLFRFKVSQPLPQLRIFCDIEERGELICRSFHDGEAEERSHFEPGEYQMRAVISPKQLGPTSKTIVFRAHIAESRDLIHREGLRIEITPHYAPHWNAPYPDIRNLGSVGSLLNWEEPHKI